MNLPLATFVHDFSPFLIRFTETIGVRWYGLTYVFGFVAAYLLIRWFIRLKACELKESKLGDFILIIAICGIVLGGRLGYMLIYDRVDFFSNPLKFFNLLGGGMASHGAIFGSILVVFLYARHQKLSWLGLGDNLVITGSLGVFFGRMGNFINGELYGRVTGHKWAMKFPSELHSLPSEILGNIALKAKDIAPEIYTSMNQGATPYQLVEMMIATARKNKEFEAIVAEFLNPRHPSQLYQGLCEGLLVFALLLFVRLKWKNAYHGMISGIFFLAYAVARFSIENLRQPDSGLEEGIMGLTYGQFLSCLMPIVGVAFIAIALITKRQNQFNDVK